MHDLTVITMLAGALSVALLLGWLTQRLGLSTLVGYLLAGIVVGPHTPGFAADAHLAAQLAEIGVILLMFGVGLHFHPQELLRVWRIAIPGAVAQSAVATLLGWGMAHAFGWGHTAGLVLGMSLAVASTVVLMRMLLERKLLDTPAGHATVGWLIVEDIFTVVALVVLPALVIKAGTDSRLGWSLLFALLKVGTFAGLAWFLGPKLISPLLERMAKTQAVELFTLAVFVVALGIASVAAGLFDVSVALGAFLGGLVVGRSRVGHQAAADAMPFRDVFSALFFVSVGMLFDPRFVLENPGMIVAALGIVLIAKPAIALLIVWALRYPLQTALTVAVGLAQIGEFSFILAALGKSLGLLPQAGFDVLVATALLSIAVNPLLFRLLPLLESRLPARGGSRTGTAMDGAAPAAPGPEAIVVGYGEIGHRLTELLAAEGTSLAVIEQDMAVFEAEPHPGITPVYGDAGNREILSAAGLAGASRLFLTTSRLDLKLRVCSTARGINPGVAIYVYVHSPAERAWMEEFGVTAIVDEPLHVAAALIQAGTEKRN
ncbi:MAG: cation:proton antiporter [Gammaproteobacteria bacterium]|nr:cation:proton antiporter [Gammaproteobacteria bacterium]